MTILKDTKIKTKIIIGNLFITVILILFNLTLYISTRNQLKNEIHKELAFYNKKFSSFIEETVTQEITDYFETKSKEAASFLKGMEEVSSQMDYQKLISFLDGFYYSGGHISLFKNGKLLYSSFPFSVEKFPFVQNKISYSPEKDSMIQYASYFKEYNIWIVFQEEKHDLQKNLNLDNIKRKVSFFNLNTDSYTYIINSLGTLILHPAYEGKSIFELRDINDINFFKEIFANKRGIIKYKWKNPWENTPKEKLAVYSSVDFMDWYIITSGYPRDFYASILPLKRNIMYVISGLLVFNALFFFYLQFVLDKPIKRLTEEIKGLHPHEYIGVEGTDEISIIAVTFNHLITTVESYSIYLESMVKEKTKELTELNESLYHLTIYDKLTDIHNRTYVMDVLSKKFSDNSLLACVLFDIDHFKEINDTYGHLGGDFVLKELSRLVKCTLKDGMEFGRYGGEEFIIILEMDAKESFDFIEDIRLLIEKKNFIYQDKVIKITSSFGICVSPTVETQSVEELLDYADLALYDSKNNGRNRTTLFKK